jgi:hypothetical protein
VTKSSASANFSDLSDFPKSANFLKNCTDLHFKGLKIKDDRNNGAASSVHNFSFLDGRQSQKTKKS